MIGQLFLGKAWHWGVLVLASVLFWLCGRERLHVIEFNIFVTCVLIGTVVIVGLVLAMHTTGERVTRDEIVPSTDADSVTAGAAD